MNYAALKQVIAFLMASLLVCSQAFAVPLIRDAEIEHTLRVYADPIFKAAGVNGQVVKLFIVQDPSLNAYVAGGANMFIHSGLIMATETPDVLIGVMAHETGHIAGGHLARGAEQMKNAQLGTVLTFVLGAAAAAASKKPEAAAAVIGGGQSSVARNFLAFTRSNEQAADQSALTTLDKIGISASGMLKMFEMLKMNEQRHFGSPDPYMLTHPLTNERIEFVRNHVAKSKIPAGQYPQYYTILHQRMVAKLYGFIQSPENTLQKYPVSDKSVPARMARAIAYYKMPDMEHSLEEMNSLIEESPNDPFFHELKGQILFENGRGREALSSYQEAVKLMPNSALILADLGKVELAQELPSLLKPAIGHLEKSVVIDNSNAPAWRLLATAYGRADNLPMSYLALAEEALLQNNAKNALQMANQAISSLKEATPAYRRAQDIKNQATEMRKQQKEDNSPF
jgi:predicted Zn-dependent protease